MSRTDDGTDSLPTELTTFIGRRNELAGVRHLLGVSRLVTILGQGGVGKTRLALRVASEVRRSYRDGVWFVELATVAANGDAVAATAAALKVEGVTLEEVVARIGDRQILIVLDNCEHLVSACAALVDVVLKRCPNARVLATSRRHLGSVGESIFELQPFSAPDPSDSARYGKEPHDAVELFVGRAKSASPGFAVGEREQLRMVAEICYRLDGLPLAIELAAVRLRALSLDRILEGLSEPFRLLDGGNRDEPDRKRTLLGSITWSYDLCTEDERALWEFLSVFVGGFSVEVAEVIRDAAGIVHADVLEVFQGLAEKSVIARQAGAPEGRFTMHATIREFALGRLDATGRRTAADRALTNWCVGFLIAAESDWFSPRQMFWSAKFVSELPNMRAALEFSLSAFGDPNDVFRLTVPLWRVIWLTQGRLAEMSEWQQRALSSTKAAGDSELRMFGEALVLYTRGSSEGLDVVAEAYRDLRRRGEILGRPRVIAGVDAAVATLMSEDVAAIDVYERVLTASADDDVVLTRLGLEVRLALLHDRFGNQARADELRDRILSRSARTGERFEQAYLLFGLGANALQRGDIDSGLADSLRSLELRREVAPSTQTAHTMETIAAASVSAGDRESAATLFGIADTVWDSFGPSRASFPQITVDRSSYELQARTSLGEVAFGKAYDKGRAMTPRQGIDWALGARSMEHPDPAPSVLLTEREREVAALVAEGLSDREIAQRLVLSIRTAQGHVQRILVKLGFSTRTQLAAWVLQQAAS